MNNKAKTSKRIISLIMIAFIGCSSMFFASCDNKGGLKQKQNVILLISDGLSPSSIDFVRSYKGGDLYYEKYFSGKVRTDSLSEGATDSAASATAYATGKKTHNGYISVNEDGNKYETLVEYANSMEIKTGIVTTCEITNATPAAFYSHASSRNETEKISRQLVHSDLNVILSSGSYYLKKENRKDGESIINQMQENGYTYINKKNELSNIDKDRVLGLFGNKYIKNELDNKDGKEPTLALMTENALRLLRENNRNGFFLMVEGSKIDWAAHSEDSIGILSEILSFEEACKSAIEFAQKDRNTTVIIVSDHRNGELIRRENDKSKVNLTKEDKKMIDGFNYTNEELAKRVKGQSIKNIKKIIIKNTPLNKVSDRDAKKIKQAKDKESALSELFNKYLKIKWISSGHNSGKVNLYIYPAENIEALKGNEIDNTDINKYIKDILSKEQEKAINKIMSEKIIYQTGGLFFPLLSPKS